MGRIRTIKPEFFLDEQLYDLEQETELPIRVGFAGLWTQADREGRFEWRPRRLGAAILPYDDVDFSRVLDALARVDGVRKYALNGVEYGVIPGFGRHQVVNNRERPSELPEPPETLGLQRVDDASTTREARVHENTCRKGREGNKLYRGEKTPPPDTPKKSRFKPPTVEEVRAYCEERGNTVEPQRFVDFYSAKGWVVGKSPMKDWKAAVRTWEGSADNRTSASSYEGVVR